MPARTFCATRWARDVARPDGGAESEARVVGELQRVRLVAEGEDRDARAEDFLLEAREVRLHVADHRRLDKPPLGERGRRRLLAAAEDRRALPRRRPSASTRFICASLTSGPICVAASIGSPSTIDFALATSASRKAGRSLMDEHPLAEMHV